MRHTGVVLETNGNLAQVRLGRAEECTSCGACGSAVELGSDPEIVVDNPIGARPGQPVLVEFDPVQTVKSGTVVFLFPIAALLLGAILGSHVGGSETAAVLGAVGGLGLAALGVILYDRRLARGTPVRPRTIQILPPNPIGEPCKGENGDGGVV